MTDRGANGDRPRLPPLPKERWDADARAALEGSFGADAAARFLSPATDAPPIPSVLGALMHHPQLAAPWLAYNNVLLRTPALDARHRELVVLRVAWRTRSPYEWAQHVRMAARSDITPEEVAAISLAADAAAWTPLESALLAATDELLDHYRVDDNTWARLAEHLDERQLTELLFVVGSYTCLAMVFNSVGLELDPELRDIAPLPPPES